MVPPLRKQLRVCWRSLARPGARACECSSPTHGSASSCCWASLTCLLSRLLKCHWCHLVLSPGPLMLHGGGGLHPLLGIEPLRITFLTRTSHIPGPDKARVECGLSPPHSSGHWACRAGPRWNSPFLAFFVLRSHGNNLIRFRAVNSS